MQIANQLNMQYQAGGKQNDNNNAKRKEREEKKNTYNTQTPNLLF